MNEEFPPNSHKSKTAQTQEPKQVNRVVKSEAVRRKKGLRKQFKSTFFSGDSRGAMEYAMFEVLVPAAKDALADSVDGMFRRLIFGEAHHRRPGRRPMSGPTGYVQYNKPFNRFAMGQDKPPQPTLSRRARATHDFDEIVLETRVEAEEVIDQMFEMLSKFESVSVADLYVMVGLQSSHTDHKWGWEDLHGAGVSRVRGGYLLDLPEPEPLD